MFLGVAAKGFFAALLALLLAAATLEPALPADCCCCCFWDALPPFEPCLGSDCACVPLPLRLRWGLLMIAGLDRAEPSKMQAGMNTPVPLLVHGASAAADSLLDDILAVLQCCAGYVE
jgi:hypothetical protein